MMIDENDFLILYAKFCQAVMISGWFVHFFKIWRQIFQHAEEIVTQQAKQGTRQIPKISAE